MFDVEAVRADFPGATQQVYLNAAGVGLPPRSAVAAVQQAATLLGQGPAAMGTTAYYRALGDPGSAAKREAARLLHVTPAEIAFVDDTTMGLNIALAALPFAAGENLILCDLEYPQVALSAQHLHRDLGVEIRVVHHRDGLVTVDDYAELMDRRTRLLLVSSVQWINGLRLDLAAFSQLADAHDCFLVVDAIQQLGAIPLDLSQLRVDFLAAGAQKWLNAPFGLGILYVRQETQERVRPGLAHGLFALAEPPEGWVRYLGDPHLTPFLPLPLAPDARRFEIHGMPKSLAAAGLAASLAYVNGLDQQAAAAHILALGSFLIEELHRRGIPVWTPTAPHLRAGIVTCAPFADAARVHRLVQALETQRIYPSVRYCSGIGGLRISIHYYTSREDLEMLLAVMDDLMPRL
ncbi:MAG: aminotransferase class V-fold PLP-dependent enzyme [Candidatus Binatia bacterium]|nr:aminotransferase class V-fold PLP-dependent enzyme [Candidatus Binatia bacterium]